MVDDQWRVQIVNQAAEAMFAANSYDLQGNSLKDFLRPWSQRPADLDHFFCRTEGKQSIFLIPPASDVGERQPVQMRFGADLEWEGEAATVLMFYCPKDLPTRVPKTVQWA